MWYATSNYHLDNGPKAYHVFNFRPASKKQVRIANYCLAADYFDSTGNIRLADTLDQRLFRIAELDYEYEYDGHDYPVDSSLHQWMAENDDVFRGGRTEADLEPYFKRGYTWPSQQLKQYAPHLHGINPYELGYLMSPSEPSTYPKYLSQIDNQFLKDKLQFIKDQGIERNSPDYRKALQFYALHPLHKRIPFDAVQDVWKDSDTHTAYDNLLKRRGAELLYFDDPQKAQKMGFVMSLPEPDIYRVADWDPVPQFEQNKKFLNERVVHNPEFWKKHQSEMRMVANVFDPDKDQDKTDGELYAYSVFDRYPGPGKDPDRKYQDWLSKVKQIYRVSPQDPIYDHLLAFLVQHPNALGAPLKQIQKAINISSTDIFSSRDVERLLSAFGNNFEQWLQKFKGDTHAAAAFVPTGTVRELQGLGQFLLSNYGKINVDLLTSIAHGWPKLSLEERKLPPSELFDIIFTKNIQKILGEDAYVRNMDFAKETARWWQDDDDDEDDQYDEDDDITYNDLEEKYLNSLQVPLPPFASAQYSLNGLTGHFLPRSDVRGMFLGQYSASCQHPWNVGAECAYHGQTSPNGAFFVVEDSKKNIVAQSWVWQDADGDVVFDNVEAKGIGPERMPVVREIYQQVAKQMDADIVCLGTGGSDLDLSGLPKATIPLVPKDYDGYRDSTQQVRLK